MSGQALRRAIAVMVVVAAGLGVGLAVRASGVRPVRITSGSMIPTVGVDEWIIVTDAETARRGDIVEFRYPTRQPVGPSSESSPSAATSSSSPTAPSS